MYVAGFQALQQFIDITGPYAGKDKGLMTRTTTLRIYNLDFSFFWWCVWPSHTIVFLNHNHNLRKTGDIAGTQIKT
jgi:hypothetical protein